MDSSYYLAFSCSPGIGPKRFRDLLRIFESAKGAWDMFLSLNQAPSSELKIKKQELSNIGIGEKTLEKLSGFQTTFDFQEYKNRLEKAGVKFIAQYEKEYPDSLRQLDDAPIGLFVKGDISSLLKDKVIGVVGTRKTTSYGREVTGNLVASLSNYGCIIVSGLALGVDAIAHKSTIDNNGVTIAVLGCGVDCCYPRENQSLYNNIVDKGGLVVSEYPLGAQPSKGSFPARNRIIAALSIGVLITEAGADSGSLITAGYALKLNKKIFAVPGPITSRQSDGTSYLLKNGAKLVTNTQDILDELQISNSQFQISNKILNIENLNVSDKEKVVLQILQKEPCQIDMLSKQSGIASGELAMLLSSLEMLGFIRTSGNGMFEIV